MTISDYVDAGLEVATSDHGVGGALLLIGVVGALAVGAVAHGPFAPPPPDADYRLSAMLDEAVVLEHMIAYQKKRGCRYYWERDQYEADKEKLAALERDLEELSRAIQERRE